MKTLVTCILVLFSGAMASAVDQTQVCDISVPSQFVSDLRGGGVYTLEQMLHYYQWLDIGNSLVACNIDSTSIGFVLFNSKKQPMVAEIFTKK